MHDGNETINCCGASEDEDKDELPMLRRCCISCFKSLNDLCCPSLQHCLFILFTNFFFERTIDFLHYLL